VIGLFTVTAAGRRTAEELSGRLSAESTIVEPPIAEALVRWWPELDAAVFFLATGAAVRLIAPLLADKHADPAVVCVDEARRFAVPVAGAHAGGANALAEEIAGLLGATAVVTTASDATGRTALDEIVGLLDADVDGDLAGCGVAVLNGAPVRLRNPLGFPLPALPSNVSVDAVDPQWTIVVDDRLPEPGEPANLLRLVPRTLVVGIGSARNVSADAVFDTLRGLERAGYDQRSVRAFATIDIKAREPGILAALNGWAAYTGRDDPELRTYPAEVLGTIVVPNPSEVVRAEVGTASVAEASAVRAAEDLAAGGTTELVLPKVKGDNVTLAAARITPRGRLAVIGLGPGSSEGRTRQAEQELRRASIVVGLDQYVEQVRHLFRDGTTVHATGLGQEEERARDAVLLAGQGNAVALIGSGDAGVYAMASPALEQAGTDIEVVGVPGVTAALAAASLLGAPLGHDHALVSLSDLHTPWQAIERRIRAAAEGDFVVCFYNPRSADRHWQLAAALDILREARPPGTPVGAVRQAGRSGQRVWHAPIEKFDPSDVDMLTTVLVGCSQTKVVAGRMVTPRGYRWMP
jgi:cobalt-precorrin 5A hydrolase/precorrin-3B C17-methyltransferase